MRLGGLFLREKGLDFFPDGLDNPLGLQAGLHRVAVAEFLPHDGVDGFQQRFQLRAGSAKGVWVLPNRPQSAPALVDAPRIHRVFPLFLFPPVAEYGGIEQPCLVLLRDAKILLHHAFLAPGGIVGRNPAQYPDNHSIAVGGVSRIEFGTPQPFGGQLLHREHHLFGGLTVHVIQNGDAVVQNHPGGVRQQLRVKAIVDDIIRQPLRKVGQNAIVQPTVVLRKGFQLPVAVHGVGDADLVDQLIYIQKGKGQVRFLKITVPQLRPPGKIAPKLLVRQGFVGGIIAQNLTGIFVVIRIIDEQRRLLEKDAFPGLPAARRLVFQGTGGAQQRRELGGYRSGCDGFVAEYSAVKPFRSFFCPVCVHGAAPFVQMFALLYNTMGRPSREPLKNQRREYTIFPIPHRDNPCNSGGFMV